MWPMLSIRGYVYDFMNIIQPTRRARALRALGLLLADGAITVGWGKTFWRVGRVPLAPRQGARTPHPDPGLFVICALLGTWTP